MVKKEVSVFATDSINLAKVSSLLFDEKAYARFWNRG